jgi:signal recognition particle subunit SRP72
LYDSLLASCDPVSLSIQTRFELTSQSSSEHPDILENISATSAHLDFISSGYQSRLSAPPSTVELPRHIPSEGELESYVPSLPSGWALGGQKPAQTKQAPKVKKEVVDKPKKGTRHRLPKDAVAGKAVNEKVRLFPMLRVYRLICRLSDGYLCDRGLRTWLPRLRRRA